MPENTNTARMAEKASVDIFSAFGWTARSLKNVDWQCVEQKKHHKMKKVKTHPTDAVFSYLDPYLGQQIYVNTDLKSYASGSLKSLDLVKCLKSLGQATECANKSDQWQQLFVDTTANHASIGMLFVYNHDGDYDADFELELEKLAPSSIGMDPAYQLGVVGPRRVVYLNSIAHDISVLKGKQPAGIAAAPFFVYPHLYRHKAVRVECEAATLWSLLSPLLLVGFQAADNRVSYYAYYDGEGRTVEEFEYLLDYLFKYQIASKRADVRVCLWDHVENAATNFEKAKEVYARECWKGKADTFDLFNQVLTNIEYREVTQVVQRFSQVTLGMGDDDADI